MGRVRASLGTGVALPLPCRCLVLPYHRSDPKNRSPHLAMERRWGDVMLAGAAVSG